VSDVKVDDYVLAAKWSDADPGDHWAVGFLNEISQDGERFFVGDDNVHSFRYGGFRHCMKITKELGGWLLKNGRILESSPPGSINLFKMLDTEINREQIKEDNSE
jgi:hypothetical protein